MDIAWFESRLENDLHSGWVFYIYVSFQEGNDDMCIYIYR